MDKTTYLPPLHPPITVMHNGAGDFTTIDPKVSSYILRGVLGDNEEVFQTCIRNRSRLCSTGIGRREDLLRAREAPLLRLVEYTTQSTRTSLIFHIHKDIVVPLNRISLRRLHYNQKQDNIHLKDGEEILTDSQSWATVREWLALH